MSKQTFYVSLNISNLYLKCLPNLSCKPKYINLLQTPFQIVNQLSCKPKYIDVDIILNARR